MLLNVENLSLSYDSKTLFNKAAFRVLEGEKIGLIGNNGVGKSTLIKVLCGSVLPDTGTIDFKKNMKVGYLDQYMDINMSLSIFEYLKEAYNDLYNKEEELNKLLNEASLLSGDLAIKKISLAENMREELESKDFYQIKSNILKISKGLGITNYGMDTQIKKLSGGQKVKVCLAKLLLEKPDLLILDEPTNFLDTIHVDWLVTYLKEYKGNFLIVSHNQYFLDNVVNVILELEFGKITRFKGNYQDYKVKKEMMVEQYKSEYNAQMQKVKSLKDYIAKNKVKTSTARQAQSRQKQLDKIEIMAAPESGEIHINPYFNYAPIASHKFLEVNDLEIGYTSSLLPAMNFTIKSGERLAITGFNGIGKSTLFKTLTGELPVMAGSFKFVENAKIAYFEQEHNFENFNITPIDEIHNIYPKLTEKEIRDNLAKCGLRGKTVLEKIKELSGGEQAKLKLCKLMMIKSNVLILDEPTNHLDKNAKEDLVTALKKYQGTIIFTSHEPEFIEKLATKIYSFEDLLLS